MRKEKVLKNWQKPKQKKKLLCGARQLYQELKERLDFQLLSLIL